MTTAHPRCSRRPRWSSTSPGTATIEAITVTPERPGIERLVGAQGGSNLRAAIDEAVPGEREQGTPLHFLLDDIAGTSLISGLALMEARQGQRRAAPAAELRIRTAPSRPKASACGRAASSARVCGRGGFAQLSRERGDFGVHFLRMAGDLSSDDPWAWHEHRPAGRGRDAAATPHRRVARRRRDRGRRALPGQHLGR